LGVEFEWNPFSTASRAARAEQEGRIGNALRLYARAGQHNRILECITRVVPSWTVKPMLLTGSKELLELESALVNEPLIGMPDTMKRHLLEHTQSALSILWDSTQRFATAARISVDRGSDPQGIAQQTSRLNQMLEKIRQARRDLADLAITGTGPGELAKLEQSFQVLASAARHTREAMDEWSP
jgi:hypothetical protein